MENFNRERLVAEVIAGKALIRVSREFAGATVGYYLRDGEKVIKVNGKSFNSAVRELNSLAVRNPKLSLARSYPRVKIGKGMKWMFCCEYSAFDLTTLES